MQRKFFQIGFNKCGTTFIAKLFQMNGIPTLHWLEGRLAEDIAYSKLVGRQPLKPWADSITAFTDMESVRYLNMPVVEAFKEFEFLDKSYPGSVFLLNTRDVEDWVISRYMHRDGTYARAYAQILGVGLIDLADIWADAWNDHIAACRSYFAGRAEFVEIDIDHADPGDYRDALAPWFDLPNCPPRSGRNRAQVRRNYLIKLDRMLNAKPPERDMPAEDRDALADRLALAAAPALIQLGAGGVSPRSDLFAVFDVTAGQVIDRNGRQLPFRQDRDGWYHLDPVRRDLLPLASAVNDIAQVVRHGTYHLDMSSTLPDHDRPTIAPIRRADARNVFLWPAAWTHRLGNNGYLGDPDRDETPWADKLDLAVDPAKLPADRRKDDFILSHRYVVSQGRDANFLSLLNSRSLVLRAEDGCEDAVSPVFQSWRHFIPLQSDAADLDAQLAWARAHPAECQRISSNARTLCKGLADPRVRCRQLAQVLHDYRVATGQE
ncbi:glycosyl transferase family 90 [Paracoccus amoyensis]|uniref:glycosyl transferase family 90 n=1 Tax=Paracoccus amoyensis TaxID=2760093 RepID=UPI001658E14A|nr:glycosyl transferase family 90 [Paracoccus amoyensis]